MPYFPGTARPGPFPSTGQTPEPEPDPETRADGLDYGDLALSLPLPDSGPGEVR
ncbi:hypothetical protein [Streptomyces abikoensis]|uniref:Uncharacterized protein n=1 Tax=Streptomyces abikoensis TaxID=97398 RepID=A0ABW7T0B8_9ACTN